MNIQVRASNDTVTDQVFHQGESRLAAMQVFAKLGATGLFRSITIIGPEETTLLHVSGVPSVIGNLFSDSEIQGKTEKRKK